MSAIKHTQTVFPKAVPKEASVNPITKSYFAGFEDGMKTAMDPRLAINPAGLTQAEKKVVEAKGATPAIAKAPAEKKAGVAQVAEKAAPKAEGMAAKLVGILRKKPIASAVTAAAAGAGAATGIAQAHEKKVEEERKRAQVRAILMSRLQGGY